MKSYLVAKSDSEKQIASRRCGRQNYGMTDNIITGDEPEFFAPVATDLIDGLLGQYQHMRGKVERVAAVMNGPDWTASGMGRTTMSSQGRAFLCVFWWPSAEIGV